MKGISQTPLWRRARRAEHPLPDDEPSIKLAAARSRRCITRRALVSSAASLVPLPGLDLIVDISMLMKLFGEINAEFGLTAEQIERLSAKRRAMVYQAIVAVGGAVVGKVVTRELVLSGLKTIGVRVTAAQAAKVVPVAGQVASAALSFGALKFVGEQHVRECVAVSRMLLRLPAPDAQPGR